MLSYTVAYLLTNVVIAEQILGSSVCQLRYLNTTFNRATYYLTMVAIALPVSIVSILIHPFMKK